MNRNIAKFMMAASGIDSKYEDFYVYGFHIRFEKADKDNDVEFFGRYWCDPYLKDAEIIKEFMLLHIENTQSVFKWTNFKEWLKGFEWEEAFIKKFNEERDIHRTTESPTLNGKKLSPKEFLEMKMNKKLTEEEFQAILKAQQELNK